MQTINTFTNSGFRNYFGLWVLTIIHAHLYNCGRARARPQTNLAFGGQRHVLKAYSASAELKENLGTFLAFLCSSDWNEWYVNKRRSKGPGVEFKLRDMGHVFHVNISKCSFPMHMLRPAFTRPSNKTFISFKERLLYGVISPPKFKLCFRHLSFIIQHCCLRCDIGVSQ